MPGKISAKQKEILEYIKGEILDRSDEKTPFELGVCAQKKRLHEPLIEAFWKILPNH